MKIAAIISTLFISTSAFAGGVFEPYIGYENGKVKSSSLDEDLRGVVIGGKLGFSNLGLDIGVDYMKGDLQIQSDPTTDFETTDLGGFVQYTFPVLLKVGASYFFDSKTKFENGTKFKGSGYKLGVGFTALPFVTINLDMININYDDVVGGVGNPDLDRKTYMLSISLPLHF